jgi:hypothetical protein
MRTGNVGQQQFESIWPDCRSDMPIKRDCLLLSGSAGQDTEDRIDFEVVLQRVPQR